MKILQSQILEIKDITLERNYQECDLAIHSDSLGAIKELNSYAIDSKLIWECRNELNETGIHI